MHKLHHGAAFISTWTRAVVEYLDVGWYILSSDIARGRGSWRARHKGRRIALIAVRHHTNRDTSSIQTAVGPRDISVHAGIALAHNLALRSTRDCKHRVCELQGGKSR